MPEPELARLAQLWDVLTSYVDVENRRIRASRESLLSVLEALGAPVSPVMRSDSPAVPGRRSNQGGGRAQHWIGQYLAGTMPNIQ